MMLAIATLETEHFSFMAFGITENAALIVMRQAWRRHRRQTGAELEWSDVEGDVSISVVETGKAYRDGEEI